MEVIQVTEFGDADATEAYYAVEASILNSCETLLGSARFPLLGEPIPLFTLLDALLDTPGCRQTVSVAREKLKASQIALR